MRAAVVGEEQVRLLAKLQDLEIAPGHMPGVIHNLTVVLEQAALLFEPALDVLVEPAPVFRP